MEVADRADHAAQPQPRGHGQGHGHPTAAADTLGIQLVGLNMLQIWLLGVEVVPVYALAMGAALVLPVGDRALIKAVGGDDGLGRAARAEEGDDDDEQGAILVQAVEGSPLGGGEGRAAGRADEAELLAGVNFDVTLVGQSPGRAVGVEAGYTVGVHGRFLRGAMTVASPLESVLDPFLATRTPFHGSLGCYLISSPSRRR